MEGQQKLKAARVCALAREDWARPWLLYLAAAGVGTLGLVDFDVVDYTNCSVRSFTRPPTWTEETRFRGG